MFTHGTINHQDDCREPGALKGIKLHPSNELNISQLNQYKLHRYVPVFVIHNNS